VDDAPVVTAAAAPRRFHFTPRRLAWSLDRTRSIELWDEVGAFTRRDGVSRFRFAGQTNWVVTDPAWCRDRPRAYPGRAVAVVDATTYSSGDLFAAGWVDNGVGPLVAVGAGPGAHATGGGGATVWTYAQLRDASAGTDDPLPALPAGCGLTVAVRRAVRSAAGDGIPLEDLGVGGRPYTMTKRDLLDGNVDLLRFCTQVLGDE